MTPGLKVTNKIKVLERNGDEVSVKATDAEKYITIESHWNRDRLVVLRIDGERITVPARKLKAAISNATNTGSI